MENYFLPDDSGNRAAAKIYDSKTRVVGGSGSTLCSAAFVSRMFLERTAFLEWELGPRNEWMSNGRRFPLCVDIS